MSMIARRRALMAANASGFEGIYESYEFLCEIDTTGSSFSLDTGIDMTNKSIAFINGRIENYQSETYESENPACGFVHAINNSVYSIGSGIAISKIIASKKDWYNAGVTVSIDSSGLLMVSNTRGVTFEAGKTIRIIIVVFRG